MKRWIGWMIAMIFALSTSAQAHPARLAHGVAHIGNDGIVNVELTLDITAFLLNDIPSRVSADSSTQLVDGPRDALDEQIRAGRERLPLAFFIRSNDQDVPSTVTAFPTADEIIRASHASDTMRFPLMMSMQMQAHLPAESQKVNFAVLEVLDTLVLTIERDNVEPVTIAISARLPTDSIALPADATPSVSEPSMMSILSRYLMLGFRHIVPLGPDHILFILGLFFLSPKIRPLLVQVTAFTVAHTITLGLAMYGLVHVSPRIVEPIIALSIAAIALENLLTTKLTPWRPVIVFAFGLLHGLGFASVLMELGLPRSAYAPALVSFNVGVELGQLSVLMIAMLIFGAFRRRTWYRPMVLAPASLAIAMVGLFWTFNAIVHP